MVITDVLMGFSDDTFHDIWDIHQPLLIIDLDLGIWVKCQEDIGRHQMGGKFHDGMTPT